MADQRGHRAHRGLSEVVGVSPPSGPDTGCVIRFRDGGSLLLFMAVDARARPWSAWSSARFGRLASNPTVRKSGALGPLGCWRALPTARLGLRVGGRGVVAPLRSDDKLREPSIRRP